MSTSPVPLRIVEVSGAEALWPLEGSVLGRLVYTQRDPTVVRPGRHTWEFGRLVVRTPAPAAVIPTTATYQVDEIRAMAGFGWPSPVPSPGRPK